MLIDGGKSFYICRGAITLRTRITAYNTIASAVLQLVNLAVNFILPQIMIRQYGSAMNGLISSTRQMISYFTVVEAGLMGAAVYALYKPLADKDVKTTSGIVSAANRYYNLSGFAFSGMVLVATIVFPRFVSGQGIGSVTIGSLVAIIGISGALEFFLVGKYKVLFTADQKSWLISLINAFGVFTNAAIIIFMANARYDMIWVQTAALAGFVLRSILYAAIGNNIYKNLDFKAKPDNKALDKRWDALVLQILGLVTSATPVVVTSLILGLAEGSVYVVYNMVFLSVSALLSTFNNGLSSIFGDILARSETAVLQRAYKQYEFVYYALLGWGYANAAILIMPFIGIYTAGFTDANYIRPAIGWLFVAAGITGNIKTPQGMLVISAGLFRETKIQSVIQAVLSISVSVALAPRLGIAGVLIGTIAANVYRSIDLSIFIPKRVTKLSPLMTYKRVARVVLLFAISVAPAFYLFRFEPSSWLEWILIAIPVSIWSLIVFVLGNLLMEKANSIATFKRFISVFNKGQESGSSGGGV